MDTGLWVEEERMTFDSLKCRMEDNAALLDTATINPFRMIV